MYYCISASTSDGLQHAPPRRRPCRRLHRCRCWHRLLLSGWQMPEQDVSSQTGLSCETVSSCGTQHLHEMRCIAVNREDLPLGERNACQPYFCLYQLPLLCALPACPCTIMYPRSQTLIPILAHHLFSTPYSFFC